MHIKTKKYLKITFILLSLFIILFEAIYLFAVPKIIDIVLKKNTFEKLLEKETGLKLKKSSLKIITRMTFSADINAKNLSVTDKNNAEVINADDLTISIFLPSLIFNTLEIKRIDTQNFYAKITKDKDNNFYLGTYKFDRTPKNNIKIKRFSADISDSKITLNDTFSQQSADFIISQVTINKYIEDKYLGAYLDAQIVTNKNISGIDVSVNTVLPFVKNIDKAKLNGDIQNFDLSAYSSLLALYADDQIKNINGVINAEFGTKSDKRKNSVYLGAKVKNFAVVMKNPYDSYGYTGDINIKLDAKAGNENLDLEKFNILTDKWQILINGEINKYKSKNSKFNLDVNIPKSDLHSMYHLIPTIENTDNAIAKLKKYGVWADITGKLKIKGNPEKPDIFGPVALTDLYILRYDEKIPKCKIDINFIGQEFDLFTKVFTQVNQYVQVEGRADNRLGGKGDFHISSTNAVDLKTTHTLLMPIHDVVGFDLGPLPYMGLTGIGNIDIRTKGTVFDGTVYGVFNFKNTTATLEGLNAKITDAAGKLDFKGKDLYFTAKNAKINDSFIDLTGKADLDGNIDFRVFSSSFSSIDLLDIAKGSNDLKILSKTLEQLEKLEGKSQIDIRIRGLVDDFSGMMEKIRLSGTILLKNNTAKSGLSPIYAKNVSGAVDFDGADWKANLKAVLFSSDFNISANSKNNRLFAAVASNNLKLDELLSSPALLRQEKTGLKNLPKTNAILDLKADYNGSRDKIEYDKIKMNGYFKPITQNQSHPFIIKSGKISLLNGELVIDNFATKLFNTTAKFDAKIQNVFSQKPIYNYRLKIHNFDISSFDRIKHMRFIPSYMKKILVTYEKYSGRADVDVTCRHNNNRGRIKLQEIKFTQKALDIPISVDSGEVILDGKDIALKSVNAKFDNTPIFLNANISDPDSNIKFNGYFTTKFTDYFANKYINSILDYPVKPKGDITLTTEFSGDTTGYTIKPVLKFSEDADIYYMGANLGDTADKREINADISVKNNIYDVRKLTYLRYMTSQNDFSYPIEIINAHGKIIQNKDKIILDSFRVATKNNANVKLFNAIFKKSVLKQGMFNCNILLNGNINTPRILGTATMTNLDIPMYDTLVKDINVKFTPGLINLSFNGNSFDSDFKVNAVVRNRVALPVTIEDIKINSKSVNLDSIINSMTKVTMSNIGMNPTAGQIIETKANLDASDFVIKKGEMTAKDIFIKGLPAHDYKAKFILGKDSILHVSDISFAITGGKVTGLASYNFKNAKIRAEMAARDVDANEMGTAFLDVKDQIFGSLDGNAVITTYGDSEEERMKNMSGSVYFAINDGKMPKLGSLEYLLKASNLLKSGITGLSLNNFLEIIAPVKTGYFESIKGILVLRDGVAQNIEIYSSGENLSLYIKGKYDFPEQNADLKVFGRLTKKADNILGPIGNTSFNSILNLIPGFKLDRSDKAKFIKDLNKIPGVEFNDQVYRIFFAKINGDVNGDNYVKLFKWIE